MLVPRHTEPETLRSFRECDDERLRAIMSGYPSRLSRLDWEDVAERFGSGATARQLQERWCNFARPGLDTNPFTLSERRQVTALAIDFPGQWKYIAAQIGNGVCRSPTQVKHIGSTIISKLKALGLEIQSGRDVEFVPDVVFDRGVAQGSARRDLVTRFNTKKALHVSAAPPATSLAPGKFPGIDSLLARLGRD
jgi:hypothetical protein